MAVTDDDVRAAAQRVCDDLVRGDIDAVIANLSDELRRNLGEVVALFPLPAMDAAVESMERGGASHVVVIGITGETDHTQVQTRWKERGDGLRIVEVSHLGTTAHAETTAPEEFEGDAPGGPGGSGGEER
jgi:hypothetical protein